MRIISVINQKGGSGKTTTAINLAAVLAKRGGKTLLVDVDPQSHCALGLAVPESQIELHVGDAMLTPDDRPLDLTRLIWPVNRSLDLMPSATRLAGLEAARGGLADREDRDLRLASVLRRFIGVYEWVVIDCPPAIGLLTFNALRASTEILVPVETGYFALRGATKQIATIRALCRRFGQAPPYRVLPTMHDETSTLSCDVLEELGRKFADCVLPVTVRFDVRLKEAASMGSPVVEYAPRSNGAQDYAALASYLAENIPVPARVEPLVAGEAPDAHDSSIGRGRGVVAIDLFAPEPPPHHAGPAPSQPAPAYAAVGSAHDGLADASAFFKPAPPLDLAAVAAVVAPISRAAELAARARRILQKSEELTQRLAEDPALARVLAPLTEGAQPDPAVVESLNAPALHPEHQALVPVPDSFETSPAPRPPPAGVVFGPRQTPQGVLFMYPLTIGPRVCIAGDHNAWSGDATPLRFNPQTGVHEVCLRLPPGRFKYRLVVVGRWVADPFNPVIEPNPFGDADSVFEMTGEAVPTPALAPAPQPVRRVPIDLSVMSAVLAAAHAAPPQPTQATNVHA